MLCAWRPAGGKWSLNPDKSYIIIMANSGSYPQYQITGGTALIPARVGSAGNCYTASQYVTGATYVDVISNDFCWILEMDSMTLSE